VTKERKETHGVIISRTHGSLLNDNINGHYGFKVGEKIYGRVYVQYSKQGAFNNTTGSSNNDEFETVKRCFRLD
jgi:hypothetical protein